MIKAKKPRPDKPCKFKRRVTWEPGDAQDWDECQTCGRLTRFPEDAADRCSYSEGYEDDGSGDF